MKNKLKKQESPSTFRLNKQNLNEVKGLGVDVTALFDSVLSDILDKKHCPICNQKIASKKG